MGDQNAAEHELSSFAAEDFSNDGRNGRTEFSLPPADGGLQAWSFLVAAFVAEAMV